MKKVMAFGTFDIFHPGHKNYLEQAKRLGKCLIVIVARDKTVKRVKGCWPDNNEEKRLAVVRESGIADKNVLGELKDKYAVIKKYAPDVIALGYDQKTNIEKLKNKLIKFKLKTKIIRLKSYHPEKYKSSKLKNNIKTC